MKYKKNERCPGTGEEDGERKAVRRGRSVGKKKFNLPRLTGKLQLKRGKNEGPDSHPVRGSSTGRWDRRASAGGRRKRLDGEETKSAE